MDINRTAPAIAEAEIQIGALAALKAEAEGLRKLAEDRAGSRGVR